MAWVIEEKKETITHLHVATFSPIPMNSELCMEFYICISSPSRSDDLSDFNKSLHVQIVANNTLVYK